MSNMYDKKTPYIVECNRQVNLKKIFLGRLTYFSVSHFQGSFIHITKIIRFLCYPIHAYFVTKII